MDHNYKYPYNHFTALNNGDNENRYYDYDDDDAYYDLLYNLIYAEEDGSDEVSDESTGCFPLFDVGKMCTISTTCHFYDDYCIEVPGRCSPLSRENSRMCHGLGKANCGTQQTRCKYQKPHCNVKKNRNVKKILKKTFETYTRTQCGDITDADECNSKRGPRNKKLCFWLYDIFWIKQQVQKKKLIAKLPTHPPSSQQRAYTESFVERYEAVIQYTLTSNTFHLVELKKHLNLAFHKLLETGYSSKGNTDPSFSLTDEKLAVTGYNVEGDKRVKVTDNAKLKRIGLLVYESLTHEFTCTATFISKYFLLTAAHCVIDYDKSKINKDLLYKGGGMFYGNMKFYPGINGARDGATSYDLRSVYVSAAYAFPAPWKEWGWRDDNHLSVFHDLFQKYSWDWALVELETVPTPHPGWMSFGYNNNKRALQSFEFESAGYPADGDNVNGDANLYKTPYKIDEIGRLLTVDKKHVCYGGQSGSAVWHFDQSKGYNIIYGIASMKFSGHFEGRQENHMMTTRINSVRYNIFKKIIQKRTAKRGRV